MPSVEIKEHHGGGGGLSRALNNLASKDFVGQFRTLILIDIKAILSLQ